MIALTAAAELLLEHYKKILDEKKPVETTPKIHVDEIAAKIAVFYEKIRNIVDYQEEHLLRKNFILRTLKRRLLLAPSGNIAESIIKEIIRSGHLQNDSIAESKIEEVQRIIDGMRMLMHTIPGQAVRSGVDDEWLMRMASNAIEEHLFPPREEDLLFELAFGTIKNNVIVHGMQLKDDEVTLQLFIAIQRTLFRVDDDRLTYRLLKFIYPNWDAIRTDESMTIANELQGLLSRLKAVMASPVAPYFLKICNRYNTAFFLVGDIVRQSESVAVLESTLQEKELLEVAVVRAYDERFTKEKSKLYRLAFFSVLSFFLSKIAIALAIEVPIETTITHTFSLTNTILNILFPPLLMLVVVAAIQMPGEHNKKLAMAEVERVLDKARSRQYLIAVPKKKSLAIRAVIYSSYIAVFIISFYAMYLVLNSLGFTIANIIVFALFVSLVAAAGVKIHNRARELSLEAEQARLGSFLVDLFAMPFITVGKWIIAGLATFNILVLLMNFIVELPFQFLIDFLEIFRGFIESKKDEIR